MAKHCRIVIYYLNGQVEEYFGGLHCGETVLRIWPVSGGQQIQIPLSSVLKYVTDK